MTPKIIDISSAQNLPPKKIEIVEVKKDHFMLKIKEPDFADSLLFGGQRKLMQKSVRLKKATKDYGDIMPGEIYSMVKTSGKKYLFVSDNEGY